MEQLFKERARNEIARIASRMAGSVGLCAIHVESDQRILLNSDRLFALASTYKIPIAIQLLKLVQQGRCSLEQMIEITTEDLSPGSGVIKELFTIPGVQLSLRNILDLAIRFSDNTASDIVLRVAGGGDQVTEMLRQAAIQEISVDRPARHILCDFYGFSDLAPPQPWSLARFRTRLRETTPLARKEAMEVFTRDPRDHGSPGAMASLLARIQRGEFLDRTHAGLLLDLMRRCRTGPARLKGQLPVGTIVAHKTGSIEGLVVNDAGIIEMPADRGHVAIAVMVESMERPEAELELTIAQIARTIYDAFLLSTD